VRKKAATTKQGEIFADGAALARDSRCRNSSRNHRFDGPESAEFAAIPWKCVTLGAVVLTLTQQVALSNVDEQGGRKGLKDYVTGRKNKARGYKNSGTYTKHFSRPAKIPRVRMVLTKLEHYVCNARLGLLGYCLYPQPIKRVT